MSIVVRVSGRIALSVAVFVLSLPATTFAAGESVVVPVFSGNAHFEPEIQKTVETMLQASPTFRQQYQRVLEAPGLVVSARTEPVLGNSIRARSTIRRYASGLIVVVMEIAPGPHQEQWIAHEFEHVLEQLDGVDVRGHAARGTGGAWYSGDRMVETLRAVEAGRAVQREIRGADVRSYKVVERTQ